MKKILIIPGNDDQNRGDQALVWETMRAAKDCGLSGEFYMFADPQNSKQSLSIGIKAIEGILLHPSRKFKKEDNIKYRPKLVVKWGCVAFMDFCYSALLLLPFFEKAIRSISSERIKTALDVVSASDVVFVKGGGFLHSYGEFTAFYKTYYTLYHIMLAKRLGKKVIMMPNSFGPFDGIGVKPLLKACLTKIDLIFSRESISQCMLEDVLGIKSVLAPDLGFYLKKDDVQWEFEGISTEKMNVGLTVRPYRFPGRIESDILYNRYIQSISNFIIWLIDNGYNPVLIEHVYNESTHERDMVSINSIMQLLKDKNYCVPVIANREYNCRTMKLIYSKFDYIVATRFHSAIFAISEGVPTIAITYGGNKGDGIMHDLGLEDYHIGMDSVSTQRLIDIFNKLKSNDIHSKYNEIVLQTQKEREQMIHMMQRVIDD